MWEKIKSYYYVVYNLVPTLPRDFNRVEKQIDNLEMPRDSMPGSEVTYYKLPIKVKFHLKVSFNSKTCCKTLFFGVFA